MASTKVMQERARERRRIEQGKPPSKPYVVKGQRADKLELREKGFTKVFIQHHNRYGGTLA